MHIRSWLALGLLLGHGLMAAQAADSGSPLSLDEARAQRLRAKNLKDEAEKRYESDKAVCRSKTIAITCLSSAKERRAEAVKEADVLGREGRRVEREIHRKELEAKAAKREAEAPARDAREQADVELYREKESRKAVERQRKSAEEPAQIEARRSKLAADKAAQKLRLEDRKKEDARRAQIAPENVKKKTEREKQHAARVRKIDERARQYADLLKRRKTEEAAKKAVQSDLQ